MTVPEVAGSQPMVLYYLDQSQLPLSSISPKRLFTKSETELMEKTFQRTKIPDWSTRKQLAMMMNVEQISVQVRKGRHTLNVLTNFRLAHLVILACIMEQGCPQS